MSEWVSTHPFTHDQATFYELFATQVMDDKVKHDILHKYFNPDLATNVDMVCLGQGSSEGGCNFPIPLITKFAT